MKKCIFILTITIIGNQFQSFAQLSQGSIVVGGNLSFSAGSSKTEYSNSTVDGPKTVNFSIMPNAEYFLTENFSAGIGMGYSLVKNTSKSTNTETVNKTGSFQISPFVRKYFPLGDKAFFYGQVGADFGFGKTTNESKTGNITVSSESKNQQISLGITPGFRYNVTEKIGLEAGIGFIGFNHSVNSSGSGNNKVDHISNSFQFQIAPNYLVFGIRYKLN